MAEGIFVSVSMGVMKPLLAKLTAVMCDHKYKKLKGLKKEVSFLKDELTTINAALEKMDQADELDLVLKNWRKHVIEMSYDIEDCIDDFMHSVGETYDTVGILQKASHYLQTFKDRNRIANQIQEIKTRVIQASERRARYKLDDCISTTSTSVVIDPRISALYKDSASLVGIENQKEELVKWIINQEKYLKVVSIVGFGGLGKTTLACEVHRKVREQFSCEAFVSVSQKPDLTRLLTSIQSQVGIPTSSYTCEVQDIINKLREHLLDKRYFVVIDDLWDIRSWNIISCVFPQNDCHSRVIVTTRIEEVARACCSDHGWIHNMKPLSDLDSKRLFFNRIFGPGDACPPQFQEASRDILHKCGGLPLAIITVASILASQPTEIKVWEYIQNSLAADGFASNPTLEDMVHILDLSYKNLPHHLKACFLYLGIYPEDYQIRKDVLVGQWVVEGFVSQSPARDTWEVAESYFNELVNRNMIQPKYDCYDIEVLSCRVHDMMLDLIVRRCREDNFCSVVQNLQAVVKVPAKFRRLSLGLSFAEADTMPITMPSHLSQVRSLAIFGVSGWMPPFVEFKFLRMLFLELHAHVTTIDLRGIVQLSQLRYLKVECNRWLLDKPPASIVLPSQIGMLRYMETLELPMRSSCRMPKDMLHLPRLSNLVLLPGTRLSDRIRKLKSLRTLDGFNLPKNSLENIKDLSELTNLEDLNLITSREVYRGIILTCADDDDTPEAAWVPALIASLGKLGNLKRLLMQSWHDSCSGDSLMMSSFSPPFHKLEHLDLSGWVFSRVPKWIGLLHKLRSLELLVKEIMSESTCREDVGIIGTLPSLVKLMLRIPAGFPRERIVIGATGFAVVDHFMFDCDAMSYLTFEEGAMPKLRKLELSFGLDAHGWDKATPVGLEHLLSLTRIEVWRAEYFDTPKYVNDMSDEQMIKGVFQYAADALPSRPAFVLRGGCWRRPRTRME